MMPTIGLRCLAAAEAALTKTLSLAPEHAMAHHVLGLVQISTNRAAQGIAECEQALALDRNLAPAHGMIGLAKYCHRSRRGNRDHVQEALRLSPRDTNAYRWMMFAGFAKLYLGAMRRQSRGCVAAIETNRNFPLAHFYLAAALAHLGRLDEARSAVQAGLGLDPTFTISRFRAAHRATIRPIWLERERIYDGMRKAGVPEG